MYWKRIFAFVVRKRGQRTLDIVKKRMLRCWRRPVVYRYIASPAYVALVKKATPCIRLLTFYSIYLCVFAVFTFIEEKKEFLFWERVDCKVDKTQNTKDNKRILNYIY